MQESYFEIGHKYQTLPFSVHSACLPSCLSWHYATSELQVELNYVCLRLLQAGMQADALTWTFL
jgi:hypothetical protein